MTQHPVVSELAKAEAAYKRALAKVADLKQRRNETLAKQRQLIAQETQNTNDTNVDIAEHFGVSEGTVRNIRREAAQPDPR